MRRAAWLLLLLAGSLRAGAAPVSSPTLDLNDCLRLAAAHNPALRQASVQFLDAQGKAITFRAILYPTLSGQALSTPLTFYVQVNEVLYSRQTMPRVRLSHLVRDQAVINYRQTLNDVVYQVRQDFIAALAAQQRAELERAFSLQENDNVIASEHLFDAGKSRRSDVLALQTQSNLAQQDLALADLARQQALLNLQGVLGVELPNRVRLKGKIEAPSVPDHLDPGRLADQALRDRPDLKLLASLQLSAEEQIIVSQNNAFPVVGFSSNSAIQPPTVGPTGSFDLERNYNDPSSQRVPGDTQLPLSLYFTWMIFDGGELAGRQQSEKAQLASQQVALDELKTSIPGEISSEVAAIQLEQETLRQLDAEEPPDQLRQSATLDYQAGRIRQLDLGDLEGAIFRQQESRLDAETRLTLALAALDHALGHGLEASLSPPGF